MRVFGALSGLGSTRESDSKDWTGRAADDPHNDDEELLEVPDVLSSEESDSDDASELVEV